MPTTTTTIEPAARSRGISAVRMPRAETVSRAERHTEVPRVQPRVSPQFRLYSSEERAEVLDLWRQVEATCRVRNQAVPLTASSEWTAAWLETWGKIVPHEFLSVELPSGPAGVVLLTHGQGRRNGPFRQVTRHIGTAGEPAGESACVEYNSILAVGESRLCLEEAAILHLLRDKSWEALCLDGFTADDLASILRDIPGAEIRYRESPYYDLRATRESGGDLLDPLGRSTRQNTRRLLRKTGTIEVEWAESLLQAEDILDELIELHQARWQAVGQPGAFHSRRFEAFQRSLIRRDFGIQAAWRGERPTPRMVTLFRVRSAGRTVGCLMLLNDRGRLLDYLSGFASFDEFQSPGVVTHVLCMQQALERGFDAYDFLVGDKRHKLNLATNVTRLAWGTWSRRGLKSRTIDLLRTVKRRIQGKRGPAAATASPGQ